MKSVMYWFVALVSALFFVFYPDLFGTKDEAWIGFSGYLVFESYPYWPLRVAPFLVLLPPIRLWLGRDELRTNQDLWFPFWFLLFVPFSLPVLSKIFAEDLVLLTYLVGSLVFVFARTLPGWLFSYPDLWRGHRIASFLIGGIAALILIELARYESDYIHS